MLINEREEALSYICFDVFAERWIVPKNVSWSVLADADGTTIRHLYLFNSELFFNQQPLHVGDTES